jgi:hypothetical protein
MEKVYRIEFMRYTNYSKETVDDAKDPFTPIGEINYLHIGEGPFLVLEKDLEYYRQFGGGFRSIEYVGIMDLELNEKIKLVQENEEKKSIIINKLFEDVDDESTCLNCDINGMVDCPGNPEYCDIRGDEFAANIENMKRIMLEEKNKTNNPEE